MANLDDVVTVHKNGVTGLNALTSTLEALRALYQSYIGSAVSLGITSATLVKTGSGRLVNLTVTVAGGAAGTIHDASSVAGATAANVIAVIPTAVTNGSLLINVPFTSGLVVKPGSSHNVTVVYS